MRETCLMVDNLDMPAANLATFERRSPVTGEVVSRSAAGTSDDARRAADVAAAALPGWAALGPNLRRSLLLAAADALEARLTDFIAAMADETGATNLWSGFNVKLAASMLREAAALTTRISGEVIPSDRPGTLSMSVRQPAGVVLGIAPWNAPVILGVRAIATPLACGNTVVLKASELCPRTHLLIGEALRDAGLPPGVCNVITNAPADASAVVAALVRHKAVRRVNFTGSTKVGKIIAGLCAVELKPALLELGGKAPFVVLEDADLDEAVAAAAFGAFMNAGQICMSTERIVVLDGVADAFVDKLVAKIMSMPASHDPAAGVPIGPMIDQSAADKIEALVADAIAKGATCHRHGVAHGTLVPATVLDWVTSDMAIYHEESFGPVVTIVRAHDEDEAIRIANDTEYGLTSAVFTRDAARGLRVAERIEAGMCHINGPTVHDEAQMPFGGTKSSGYGRFGGKAGIAEFTELRWITLETLPGHFPF